MVDCGQLVVFCVAENATQCNAKRYATLFGIIFSAHGSRRCGLRPGIANGQL
jgi:hypothetical protein